ncbi:MULTISPECIES: hypothetical protein [unclassified Fibrobacter]|uniref:hypothetical protein n=1 Tax=unclassified Fibrobacter TaxID=2634177 RepID=UPI000D6D55A9|nr:MULTISPECIES: hypothetical protein [unclassified Fibrobacter]PWJ70151.1 hypothetical protein BGX12_103116 [Fibrobacter sp. UWR4]PZW73500.1 hypothetical protein C8E88_1003118 [Fibrobacter sp. UWR1]
MAKISHCTVLVNGKKYTGISKFKEKEVEFKAEVDTMDGTSVVDIPRKHGFEMTYIPDKGADLDVFSAEFDGNATVIVQYTGGKKVTYTGCSLLKETPNELDGKTAKEYALDFHAEDRKDS